MQRLGFTLFFERNFHRHKSSNLQQNTTINPLKSKVKVNIKIQAILKQSMQSKRIKMVTDPASYGGGPDETEGTGMKRYRSILARVPDYVHEAEALVLQCMDFRLVDDTASFFNNLGYMNKYDDYVVPGASLGVIREQESKYDGSRAWKTAFESTLNFAVDKHNTKEVLVVDHMQCGFYKHVYGDKTTNEERHLHVENLEKIQKYIEGEPANPKLWGVEKPRCLTVKCFLEEINGDVVEYQKKST